LFYKASKQYFPDLLRYLPLVAGLALLAIALFLVIDKNAIREPLSDRAGAWITNTVVVILIATISTGYVLLGYNSSFAARAIVSLGGVSIAALFAGGLLRKVFSKVTWLAYGITSLLGVIPSMFLALTWFSSKHVH
jgi:hypothetical protein